jgi:PAS domain S-box-containing protein
VLSAVGWAITGLLSGAAVAIGVRRNRPARVGPWLLLAGSILAMTIGDVSYARHAQTPATIAYLSMFPLVTLGVLRLTRGGALLVDRARLIDLLAFTCSILLVVWIFVVGSTGEARSISPADAIGDLLLVVVAARLIVAAGRNWSAALLGVGAIGLLTGDVAYPLISSVGELGYLTLYLAWGAAALHPSMARLTAPAPARPSPWLGRWAALLGASVATPPAVLLYEAMNGGVTDGVVIALASGLTLVLAITRLADAVEQNRLALVRERGLRQASAALVAAVDVPEVDVAVRAAVRKVLPRGLTHEVVFATEDRQSAIRAYPAVEEQGHARSWWLAGPAGEPTTTLVCPLWLEPLAVARPSGGALVLTSRLDALTATRDVLEVLAGQAALALDRISLVAAVSRRDSDAYLSAVIQNTVDVMLVIDDDQRVRYASPALATLLGAELAPFAMLSDVVHPDDYPPVEQALLNAGGTTDGLVSCTLRRADGTQTPVELAFRDLRADPLVQGFVLTARNSAAHSEQEQQVPGRDGVEDLPSWINRRNVSKKFHYGA